MKTLLIGFNGNEFAKEDVRSFVEWNWDVDDTRALTDGLKIKAITTKSGNVKGFKVYYIGSSACIYEVDGMTNKAYKVHRGKRTEEFQILSVHAMKLFDYWMAH